MLLLQEFIDQHYIGPARDELVDVLGKYGLDTVITNVINGYEKQLSSAKADILPIASNFASISLIAINQKIGIIDNTEDKLKIKKAIAGMALRLFLSFIRQFPNDALHVIDVLGEILPTTCTIMGYDYKDLQIYFNPEQLRFFIREISGGNAVVMEKIAVQKKRRLIWTDKANLDYLSHEMKRRKWIEKKIQWTDFLDSKQEPGVVLCCGNRKPHIAYLLYSLYHGEYIRSVGHKGYFTIAQMYIRDYSSEPFARSALKKLSSKIFQFPDDHIEIIEEVKDVMSAMNIKPRDY